MAGLVPAIYVIVPGNYVSSPAFLSALRFEKQKKN
jgi:hypothetical protein